MELIIEKNTTGLGRQYGLRSDRSEVTSIYIYW